jgi:hypothetical protein
VGNAVLQIYSNLPRALTQALCTQIEDAVSWNFTGTVLPNLKIDDPLALIG